ncbi:MAG: metallophosphoesterase [Rectinemataceae bacterium]
MKAAILPLLLAGLGLGCGLFGEPATLPLSPLAAGPSPASFGEFHASDYPSLPLGADGTFRILVLADIQVGLQPFMDAAGFRQIRELAALTEPDFILSLGDNSVGPFAPGAAKSFAALLGSLGRPWGTVLGNHDAEGPRPRSWYGELYARAKGSLFSPGPASIHGVGNWVLRLVDGGGRDAFALVMLDSGEYRNYPGGRRYYDYIHPDQISWYEWLVQGLSGGEGLSRGQGSRPLPTLLAFHIPLPQMSAAVEAFHRDGRGAADRGFAREAPCPPLEDSCLFARVKRLGSTSEILSGHDHLNNISLLVEGIRLTYGTKTGPSSYHAADLLGGTLVTVYPTAAGYASRSEAIILPAR